MKIAVVASEAAPFVKTGGLGDVMQALPLALSKQKNTYVSLFLPYYSQIKYSEKWPVEFLGAFDVPLAWRREYVGIFRLKTRRKKLQIYFIDNEHYFNRGGIYGFADDGERYAYFSKAVLAAMNYLELRPDVVSCHDWQAALIPLLLKTEYHGCFPETKSVFTIHNIEYQGKCNLQFNYDVLGLGAGCDEILHELHEIRHRHGRPRHDRLRDLCAGAAVSVLLPRARRRAAEPRQRFFRHHQRH